MENKNVSLIAKFWVKEDQLGVLRDKLNDYVADILRTEPETLIYRVHYPRFDYPQKQVGKDQIISNPESEKNVIHFFEKYLSWEAFQKHSNGDVYNSFIEENKESFIQDENGQLKIEVVFLDEIKGFNN